LEEGRIELGEFPYRDRAEVPMAKVRDYLLSETHPVGRTKAHFFKTLGYRQDAPESLQAALLGVAREGVVVAQERSRFGSKFVVDGYLGEQSSGSRAVRTVWILEEGSTTPRLITAYPAPGLWRQT
jgi:hypothetical protein